MSNYKERTLRGINTVLDLVPDARTALDFGSGDGWYARKLADSGRFDDLKAIDVKLRDHVYFTPMLYGTDEKLPFADAEFDLVYAVDVLHHCPSPLESLAEITRVCSKYIVIKDHTYSSWAGRLTLAVLDDLGNRRFGIPSPHNYQRDWEWSDALGKSGWAETSRIWPARCHTGMLGALTNGLQFISIYKRPDDSSLE